MLGRKSYTREEYANARAAVGEEVGAYRHLVTAIAGARAGTDVARALELFDEQFFNSMILVLDRHFVHRLRAVAGKGCNPLNEVEMLADSLLNNHAVLRGSDVIKWKPDQTVLKLKIGDRISLNAEDFGHLSAAFFTDLTARFL